MSGQHTDDRERGLLAAIWYLCATIVRFFSSSLGLLVAIIERCQDAISNVDRSHGAREHHGNVHEAMNATANAIEQAPMLQTAAPTRRLTTSSSVVAEQTAVAAGEFSQTAAPRVAKAPETREPALQSSVRTRPNPPSPPQGEQSAERVEWVGTLSWAGMRRHRKGNGEVYEAYTIYVRDKDRNDHEAQGVQLETALANAGITIGDRVRIVRQGKQYVGTYGGKKTFRNNYIATKL